MLEIETWIIALGVACGLIVLAIYLCDPDKNLERYLHEKAQLEQRIPYEYIIWKAAYAVIFLTFVINFRTVIKSIASKVFKLLMIKAKRFKKKF